MKRTEPDVPPIDLDRVVLINESACETVAGSVSVFRSLEIAQDYLEPWWVEDSEGYVMTASGVSIEQRAGPYNVTLIVADDATRAPELAVQWLVAAANAVQVEDRARNLPVRPLPSTAAELVRYIGFHL